MSVYFVSALHFSDFGLAHHDLVYAVEWKKQVSARQKTFHALMFTSVLHVFTLSILCVQWRNYMLECGTVQRMLTWTSIPAPLFVRYGALYKRKHACSVFRNIMVLGVLHAPGWAKNTLRALWDFRLSWQPVWRLPSSGMLNCVVW